ncbi:MAG: SDR family oxidoreductase [Rhodospirillaceae bacterium]|jgi:NADP-dependent 3-hydroxy acid dehydrogenase YdfG|nr:SDR family oxidoreductase [Rhodospirillaceae bacterium]MBT6136945.1 SDR family oxidoreductase [Rhodospirillaceae bacterium]
MRSLEGMVAWVTGAGTGMGRESAIKLAEAGCKLVLTGRRQTPLDEVAAVITNAGGEAAVETGDASDRPSMFAIAKRIEGRHGRIDILFNNHGINLTPRSWAEAEFDGWDELIDVNVKGAYNCAGAVLPIMRKQADGLIMTTSSLAGRFYSSVAGPAYGASKHAVMALNDTLNQEEGNNGIRACALCPGEVATPILDQRPVTVPQDDVDRLVQSEDIGDLVVFVAQLDPRACVTEIVVRPTHRRTKQPGER